MRVGARVRLPYKSSVSRSHSFQWRSNFPQLTTAFIAAGRTHLSSLQSFSAKQTSIYKSSLTYRLATARQLFDEMESFFQGWISRHQHLLQELLSAPRDQPSLLRPLIDRVFAHYHEYYHEKARLAARDVLLVFSPAWLSPYERTFLWITGWKPSMAFCLLRGLGEDGFSPEQRHAIAELQRETAAAERELSEEMARVQEAMAMPQVLGLVRRARDGELRTEAVEMVVRSLEVLAGSADGLRARTVNRIAEILSPAQTVDFLAAAAQLHFRIREWGLRRAAGRTA